MQHQYNSIPIHIQVYKCVLTAKERAHLKPDYGNRRNLTADPNIDMGKYIAGKSMIFFVTIHLHLKPCVHLCGFSEVQLR